VAICPLVAEICHSTQRSAMAELPTLGRDPSPGAKRGRCHGSGSGPWAVPHVGVWKLAGTARVRLGQYGGRSHSGDPCVVGHPPARPGGSRSRPSPREEPSGRSAANNASPVGTGCRRPSPSRWQPPLPRRRCSSRIARPRRNGPSGPRFWLRQQRPLGTAPRTTSQYYLWIVRRKRRSGNSSPRRADARSCAPPDRGRDAGAATWRQAPRCFRVTAPFFCIRTVPRGSPVARHPFHSDTHRAACPSRDSHLGSGGPARSAATWGTVLKRNANRGWGTTVKWLSGLSLCVCARTCFVGCPPVPRLSQPRAPLK